MGDIAVGFEAPDADLSAVGDEPIGEPSDDGVDAGAEPGGPGAEPGAEPGEPGKEFHAVENGRLSAVAKAAIDELKAKNPALSRAVQRALFAEDRFRKELPGGFREVATLREKLEQLGGDEGIQSLQGELEGWKDFDAKYTAGDPAVLQFLTETPEAKDAFLKIAPAAFEKFREVNPEGYGAYIAQVMAADMGQYEYAKGQFTSVATLIERLADLVPAENTKAVSILQVLSGYVQRVYRLSQGSVAPPATATAAKPGADPRAAELDTREETLRRQEWKTASEQQHGRAFADAWKRLVLPSLPKEQDKADAASKLIRRLYGIHLQEKLAAKKDFGPNMDRYFKAKQKDGFLRLHESTFKDAVPLALRSAMAEAGVGTPRRAPAPGGGGQPGKPGQPAKPATGFTPVAAKPSMAEVNRTLTTDVMWQKHQAILRDGKRVTWQ